MTVSEDRGARAVYANPAARRWRTRPPEGLLDFHRSIPGYAPTRLVELPRLAAELGAARVWVKEESARYGLPAFKMLGASYAIARALSARLGEVEGALSFDQLSARAGETGVRELIAATDGNHGRAVAHTARLLGLHARILTPAGVSAEAVAGIAAEGARVTETGLSYDAAVGRAAAEASGDESLLVQDTSWAGYEEIPAWIVDGYGTVLAEAYAQLAQAGATMPTLVTAPTGVGAFAEAVVRHARSRASGRPPQVAAVEPSAAPSLMTSLLANAPVAIDTGPTVMAGLNCGTPAADSWPALRDGVDLGVLVTDAEAARAVLDLAAAGVDSGPCGAASLAGVRRLRAQGMLDDGAHVLLISTEGRDANPLPEPVRTQAEAERAAEGR